jgi:excisionase family DNA binding protein
MRDADHSRPEAQSERQFLSRREVSRLFGVSASTVTRWARLGLLEVVRTPGGHYRFPLGETRRAALEAASGARTGRGR